MAGPTAASASSIQENNSTRHVHPDEANENGDLEDVEGWLAGRMGSRLEESSVQLSQGEYERARSLVGDDYRDLAGKYVDVAGETRGSDDDETADRFEEAGETQDEFVSRTREYRETREEYREAKNAGDEQRARELARELEQQADAIDETGESLQRQYEDVSNASNTDLSDGTEAVEAVRTNVTEQQAEIRAETFVETRLSLTADDERVSFSEPLEATGRLVAANGSAVANRTVHFSIGDRDVTTRTDSAGRFSLTYRPTTLPVGEQAVPIRYVPANASAYLGSEANVSVTVEQVEPQVRLASEFDAVAFGDRLHVDGSVDVEDVGASGVPVVVTLGDERLGEARTGSDGSFTFEGRVPAAVEAGERDLSVRVPLEDRALAGAATSSSVAVESTDTRLALAETDVDANGQGVSGTLETVDGRPVPGERVVVAIDGTRIGTVRTGEDGSFAATLDVPGQVRPETGEASRELVATFDGERTNLEDSRASTPVVVSAFGPPGGNGGDGGSGIRVPLPWVDDLRLSMAELAVGGVAGIGLIGAVAIVLRRRGRESDREDEVASGDTAVNESAGDLLPENSGTGVANVAEIAARRLDEGATDAAVETAYAAVRSEIEGALGVAGGRTHWEFLRDSRAAGLNGEGYAALESVTEGYERAAFAPEAVPVEEAERIVEVAQSLSGRLGGVS